MKLWPVVTGVAIALTLVACKSPTPPKGVQPISVLHRRADHRRAEGVVLRAILRRL